MSNILEESRTEVFAANWKASRHYDAAEKPVQQFWVRTGHFRPYLDRLDLDHVVELACGHGRHVPHYLEKAGRITLADATSENIELCRRRFDDPKISFLRNDGRGFRGIADAPVSAIFSYDAMVHFEILDVNEYLRDSMRILRLGGMVLFHYSNLTAEPEKTYESSPHWRNFMSAEIMRDLASRAGPEVPDQSVIDWGGWRRFFQLDRVTLMRAMA